MKPYVIIQLRIDPELAAKLKAAARQNDRSVNAESTEALTKHLEAA